jgi:SnoaL-like polyketide cyclase.
MELPEIIAAYIDAYNARDVDAMLFCLGEDIVFRNIAGGEVNAATDGKAAFADLARVGVEAFSARRQRVTDAIVLTGRAMLVVDYAATVAADLPNGWTKGQELAFEGRSYFEWRDGKITLIVDEM